MTTRLVALVAVLSAFMIATSTADIDYRQEMRNFVIGISKFAKAQNPNFAILPQNGIPIISTTDDASGALAQDYVDAIDGTGQEDLFFGYDGDNVATKPEDTQYIRSYLDRIRTTKRILVTDYCSGQTNMNSSYNSNKAAGYISFAADHRELDNIPSYPAQPRDVNTNDITQLSQAQNFLYLINTANYATKAAFLSAVTATNFDVILMDAFISINCQQVQWTAAEIDQLKTKANGGKRLVISYMSIGEAENYRYYWQNWTVGNPSFVDAENPQWKGNFKVKYWDPAWQSIIFGNADSYTQKLVNSHFDGAYLDIIEAFEYYEGQTASS